MFRTKLIFLLGLPLLKKNLGLDCDAMRSKTSVFLFLGLLFCCVAAATTGQTLQYDSNGLNIKAKIFYPKKFFSKKLPAIVYSHDGVSGLSPSSSLRCQELANAGFVVMAPSFRGEDGSDGEIEVAKGEVLDVLAAIQYLRAQPQVDANRIALFGTSHGALVSLLASATDKKIRALVFAYGVANIYSWFDYLQKNNLYANDALDQKIYGAGPQDKPQNFLLRYGLAAVPNVFVPTLIVQGEKDTIVPVGQAKELQIEMKKFGKNSVLHTYPNSGHGFLIYRERELRRHGRRSHQYQESVQAWRNVLQFLHSQLAK